MKREEVKKTIAEFKNELHDMAEDCRDYPSDDSIGDREYYILMGRVKQLCCEGYIGPDQVTYCLDVIGNIQEYARSGHNYSDVINDILTWLEICLNKHLNK